MPCRPTRGADRPGMCTLIRGKLHDGDKHCAMGCFWVDHPGIVVKTAMLEEIAQVNDSLSDRAKPRTRWKRVQRYLRQRLAAFEANRAGKS